MSETKASWHDFRTLEQLFNPLWVDANSTARTPSPFAATNDPNDYMIHFIKTAITMCRDWTPADWAEFKKYLDVCNQRGELHVVREGGEPA